MMDTHNAKIVDTFLGREDHGIFTYIVTVEYSRGHQGFGIYSLDDGTLTNEGEGFRRGTVFGMEMIIQLLDVLGVESWEKLKGTPCRIQVDGTIKGIGHFMKDRWLNTAELYESLKGLDK